MEKIKSGYLICPVKCKEKGCFGMTQAVHLRCNKHQAQHRRLKKIQEKAGLAK